VTVRALAETGSYEIDAYTRDPVLSRHWNTIDKVIHPGADGRLREYSSKPPLLASVVAVVYGTCQRCGMLDFRSDVFWAVRGLLFLCQVLPLTVTLAAFAWYLDRWPGWTDTTRILVFTAACWGTYVTTFAVTLNNHHFAVLAVYWTLFAGRSIACRPNPSGSAFVGLGLSAGLAAATELPALIWTVTVLALSAWRNLEKTLRLTVPALLIVALLFFGTNLMAHRTLRMPYSFRSDGPAILRLEPEFQADLQPGPMPLEMRQELNRHSANLGFLLGPSTWIEENRYPLPTDIEKRWVIRDYYEAPLNLEQWRALAIVRPTGSPSLELRKWGNWYDYPGSYWHDDRRSGVDVGEASVSRYAFHCLVGHHGIFSLTPLWCLSLLGCVIAWQTPGPWRTAGLVVAGISLVVLGFYLTRPPLDRNYGGQTSALRWMFWLSPLWLVMLLPAVQWLGRFRGGGVFVAAVIAASAASALYSGTNPWVHPWPYLWLLGK
jgi:hypothetical protein